MSISHRITVLASENLLLSAYHCAKISDPTPTLHSSNSKGFLPGSEGSLPPKMKLIDSICFGKFCTWTHRGTETDIDTQTHAK